MAQPKLKLPRDRIEAFCRKWGIVELSLFGSVLRDDFGPESDVDVLVTFGPGAGITYDNRVDMLDDLKAIFGRDVDLVEKRLLGNPFRRYRILTTSQQVYAA